MTAPKPIHIPCEGSGCPTNNPGHALGMCTMCGALVVHGGDGFAWSHDRLDVLAMLKRGDFG